MTHAEQVREIAKLRQQVARHDELYYRRTRPEISDFEYDKLKRKLDRLEKSHPEAAQEAGAETPTARVGDDRLAGFVTARHRVPMQSLDNTYSEHELREFHARLVRLLDRKDLAYVVEPKIDGLAVNLTYERGHLVRAVTRGNGIEGDDITANVRTIRGLPVKLTPSHGAAAPDLIEIRGEIYLTAAEFQRLNEEREEDGLEPYANPRNLAAGSIKLLDPAEVARRHLQIVLYGFGDCVPPDAAGETQGGIHERVRKWGLPGVEKFWRVHGIDEVWSAVGKLDGLRHDFRYGTDGAVIKLDSLALQRDAGSTSKAPRWAMAYKFAAEQAETRIHAITVQVGRTGVLTPVAELDPVVIAGSTVSRATLHNRDEIARKDIRVGDQVVVEKAGEVIPAVVRVNLARRPRHCVPYKFPDHCPICGTKAVRREGEVAVRCPNAKCPAQVRRRVRHFASKGCVDIDGMGEAQVDLLVEKGWVRDPADLFQLKREDLLSLGKNVEKSTDNLLAAIERAKHAELWRYIHGLGIPHVGGAAAKLLARRFGSLEALAGARYEDFVDERKSSRIEGIGDTMATAIVDFFREAHHRSLVQGLREAGIKPQAPATGGKAASGGPLDGLTFVLTGTLPSLRREEATERIEAAGGKVSSSVSRKTDYVLAGAEPGSKLDKARTLGVKVIDEDAFLRLLKQ